MRVDAERPEPDLIDRAAELLRSGELVAFPTETVYGLGANALDSAAVAGIFRAKGRPATNPLIVHVSDTESAMMLTSTWPETATALTKRFWPGPLTLVLPRTDVIPDIVTCGGSTVAVRSPAHPAAQALLRRTGFPLAAPSANLSEHLSPTTAAHVLADLDGRIAMILDAGAAPGGIESTVLSITGPVPKLLRPGLISPAEIEEVIGPISRESLRAEPDDALPAASPGMMARHYAPRAPLQVVENSGDLVAQLAASGERVGWLALYSPEEGLVGSLAAPVQRADGAGMFVRLILVKMPTTAVAYASVFYARLREMDDLGVTRIIVDELPNSEEWMAVRDRLSRASSR